MATITLTQRYSNLNNWPGNLFNSDPGVTINTQTASSYSFTYNGGDFLNYRVVISGTDFQFDAGVAIGGTMTQLGRRLN